MDLNEVTEFILWHCRDLLCFQSESERTLEVTLFNPYLKYVSWHQPPRLVVDYDQLRFPSYEEVTSL